MNKIHIQGVANPVTLTDAEFAEFLKTFMAWLDRDKEKKADQIGLFRIDQGAEIHVILFPFVSMLTLANTLPNITNLLDALEGGNQNTPAA